MKQRQYRPSQAAQLLGVNMGGEFRRQLAYEVQVSCSEVIVADRWFLSSRLCRTWGPMHTALTLKDRVFQCGGGSRGISTPVDIRAAGAGGTVRQHFSVCWKEQAKDGNRP